MSKGLLVGILVLVVLVLAGIGGFAFYKVQEAEAAAAEASAAEDRAKRDLAHTQVQADIAERAAEEERKASEKAGAAAAKKRDKKIASDLKSYAYGHYEDHKDPGSIYTWSYSSHKVIDRDVSGDGNVTVTLKIFASAQPPVGRVRSPTSTHRLTYNSDGERTEAETISQTK